MMPPPPPDISNNMPGLNLGPQGQTPPGGGTPVSAPVQSGPPGAMPPQSTERRRNMPRPSSVDDKIVSNNESEKDNEAEEKENKKVKRLGKNKSQKSYSIIES